MIERCKRSGSYVITEQDAEKHSWAEWAWQSHYWVETSPEYFRCKFCNVMHTGCQGISFHTVKLCLENPIIKRLKQEGKL